jgi:tripartite-type tricarboxylate transporter receptor subunit TctC
MIRSIEWGREETMLSRRSFTLTLAASALAPAARAQDYPNRPIHLVVPFAAGGGADAVARIVAQRVSETIGQQVVVENRGGAAAIIGTEAVSKADPDGYTLVLGQSGPISINPALYKELRYDPVKSFAPITLTTSYPYILVVNAKLPAKTVQEFVALAKQKPDGLSFGTAGKGGANHLVTEMFSQKAGIKMVHVPYRGTAPAVTDLIAGNVQLVFSDVVSAMTNIQAGNLRALAVTSAERAAILPDVPTLAESGFPGFDAIGWHGILAPAGTPPAIIKRLHDEIVKGLKNPATAELMKKQGLKAVGNTPEEFAAFIKRDIALWGDVARRAGVAAN